ncbi:M56 family metallopeptidase [candidate division KSB1 bacterium]
MDPVFEYLNSFVPHPFWQSYMFDLTVKGSVILIFVYLLTSFLKNLSASLKHFMWNIAVISIFLIPVFSAYSPKYEIPIIEMDFAKQFTIVQISGQSPGHTETENTVGSNSTLTTPVDNTQNFSFLQSIKFILNSINIPSVLFFIWISGALVIFIQLLINILGPMWLIRKAKAITDPGIIKLAEECEKVIGCKKRPKLLRSKWIEVPLSWGWINPAIILPENHMYWSSERLEVILLHEMAHIKRNDSFTTIFGILFSMVFWYNPLTWITLKKIYFERESASDDYVLRSGKRASEYADHLLDIVRTLSVGKPYSPFALAITYKSNLEERIMSIFNTHKSRSSLKPSMIAAALVFTLIFIVPFAVIQTWAQIEEQQPERIEVSENIESESDVEQVQNKSSTKKIVTAKFLDKLLTQVSDQDKIKRLLADFYKAIEEKDFDKVKGFIKGTGSIETDKYTMIVSVIDDLKKVEIKLDSTFYIHSKDSEVAYGFVSKGDYLPVLNFKHIESVKIESNVKSVTKTKKGYKVIDDLKATIIYNDDTEDKNISLEGHEIDFVKVNDEWKISNTFRIHIKTDKDGKSFDMLLLHDGIFTILTKKGKGK